MTASRTARVWLTDGSAVPFTDIAPMDVLHPSTFGQPAPYKGCAEEAVAVGEAVIQGERADDALFPEAEWCIAVVDPAARRDPTRIGDDTAVRVQGLIEGKWLNRLTEGLLWRPASLGNNLLASGPGILTTLGAIERGECEPAELTVSYRFERAGAPDTRVQRTSLADLRGQNVAGLVRAAMALPAPCEWVDCSAAGPTAAIVNEPRWASAAMAEAGLTPADLTGEGAWARLVAGLARAILREDHGVPPGAPVELAVRSGGGAVVGRGTLIWRRDGT